MCMPLFNAFADPNTIEYDDDVVQLIGTLIQNY